MSPAGHAPVPRSATHSMVTVTRAALGMCLHALHADAPRHIHVQETILLVSRRCCVCDASLSVLARTLHMLTSRGLHRPCQNGLSSGSGLRVEVRPYTPFPAHANYGLHAPAVWHRR